MAGMVPAKILSVATIVVLTSRRAQYYCRLQSVIKGTGLEALGQSTIKASPAGNHAFKTDTKASGRDSGRADRAPENHTCRRDRAFFNCHDRPGLFRTRFLAASRSRISARAHIKPDRALPAETGDCGIAERACTCLACARHIFGRCLSVDGSSDRVD